MKDVFKKIKRHIDKKIEKGFTLVELLAVIVILAIIMLIAIPAVLSTLEVARRKAFIEYTDKVANLAEQKTLSTELLLETSSNECTIYDITKDLDLSSTGDYKGYILVKKTNTGKEYIITMWDDNLMLRPYNYTNKINHSNESMELSDAIEKYSLSSNEELSISNLCGYGCKECTTISNEVVSGTKNLLYDVLKEASEEGTYAKEYIGPHQDSMNASLSTEKIYHWNVSSNANAKDVLEKNNVIFGGFCWQMIRTTDTGGVKMIYNGPVEDGKCLSSRSTKQIGETAFNIDGSSPAGVGYMYNINYDFHSKSIKENYKYSKTFTWDGSKYILDEATSVIVPNVKTYENINSLKNAHYTCWNLSGECTTISYAYSTIYYQIQYIDLNNGKSVEDALNDMLYGEDVNKNDSEIKKYIESWYENNLISYSNYLEDTIFCNDRRQIDFDTNGWNPNGGDLNKTMNFLATNNTELICGNDTDKFSTLNEKAKLKYKIGLISKPEMRLVDNSIFVSLNKDYWLISPEAFWSQDYLKPAINSTIRKSGGIHSFDNKTVETSSSVRPAISLKPGTVYKDGDGSTETPYIIN